MRCGILIIGSLLWDTKTAGRECWRQTQLNVSDKVFVRASIHYGRKSKSRSDTYTMTFRAGEPSARGALVPCVKEVKTIDDLVHEARALWRAEARKSKDGAICSEWGCVAAMFGTHEKAQRLAKEWGAHFFCKTCPDIPVVVSDGTLNVPWPKTLEGQPAGFDIILATATQPEAEPPSVHSIADAWVNQCGHESYFFNNVAHGIRTAVDGDIWRRIEEKAPCWLANKKRDYDQAIGILRSEAAKSAKV